MGGGNKQVRVDNWGIFFLERLQLFFSKTDYCDLTLQFQGNVQLKVHRLVLNACTEYFELLENSDRLIDDNVILMPDMLQADVTVPIINFMYTGMLEYPIGIHSKLYQAADLMRIPVLTKLLDAQRQPVLNKPEKPKVKTNKQSFMPTRISSPVPPTPKKVPTKISTPELPSTMPGRKLPVWKRKTVPLTSNVASFSRSDMRSRSDGYEDEAKPTRFEWPEDDLDLPPLDLMDLSEFGDISYTSKPLLIEDEVKPIIQSQSESSKSLKEEIHELNMDEKTEEQSSGTTTEKRKMNSDIIIDKSPKRIKIVEGEKDTTISVISSGYSANFDPTKIVSEILKKYPHLVKKKKNIKLKILSKPKEKESANEPASAPDASVKKVTSQPQQLESSVNNYEPTSLKDENTWYCKECSDNTGKPMEFVLYYLYRKHMTDVHNIKFDARICKYCGIALAKTDLHAFHLFTKHGIKPAGSQVFPSCSQCPYVALSKQALISHKKKHKSTEMQCTECKLAFVSADYIASHIQITSHMGKTRKSTFDCQYCTKTSQSAISLLSHIKSYHEAEGRRDGIVSLDEIGQEERADLEEEAEQEGEVDGEFSIPEMKCQPPNRVKIISDVKVPATKSVNRTEIVTLDQNKVHSNVPGTISTSLGLLDIVVLDENQQFILQNQGEGSGENRTEYILPQLAQRNVRGDGLESSADELVMMLTDQDYKDGHSAITTDNSNIVVLYSHPADGQQGQFITSQSNLMVNQETGLLEIRNGATIATTSASQIVLRDSHTSEVETIEMIQREIDGTQSLKHDETFYAESKPVVMEPVEETEDFAESQHVDEGSQSNKGEDTQTSGKAERKQDTEHRNNGEELNNPDDETQAMDQSVEETSLNATEMNNSGEEFQVLDSNMVDNKNESNDLNNGENAELKETSTNQDEVVPAEVEDTIPEEQSEESAEPLVIESTENNTTSFENSQRTIIMDNQELSDESQKNISENNDLSFEDSQRTIISETPMEIEERDNSEINVEDKIVGENEAEMICTENVTVPEGSSRSSCGSKDGEKPYSPTDNPIDMQCEVESTTDTNEKQDNDSVHEQDNSLEMQCDKSQDKIEHSSELNKDLVDRTDSLSEDEENEPVSREKNKKENATDSATISILNDWEDTDSQHSDSKTKLSKKGAQETVHKLMDDWEEEEVEK